MCGYMSILIRRLSYGICINQVVYEKECRALFVALDQLEHQLSSQSYLFGDKIWTDVRLFTTLIRLKSMLGTSNVI